MKKILLLIFFNITIINAQMYEFNTLTKYLTTFQQDKTERIIYTNSDDDTYSLRVIKYACSFKAVLIDYQNLKIHNFEVIEINTTDEITWGFAYENTMKIEKYSKDNFSKHIFDFKTMESNDSIKKIRLSVYRNSKKRKLWMVLDLELKEHKLNLFPAFRINCIHPYEFATKLNIFENYIVLNAKGNSLYGSCIEHKLLEYKAVKFELTLPNNLTMVSPSSTIFQKP